MFEILASDSAERDLSEIRDYLLGELFNPQAWENLVVKIREAYDTLQAHPLAFAECDDERLRRKGYRKCVLGGYLFIYRVDDTQQVVHIVRYFHGLQNYTAQL